MYSNSSMTMLLLLLLAASYEGTSASLQCSSISSSVSSRGYQLADGRRFTRLHWQATATATQLEVSFVDAHCRIGNIDYNVRMTPTATPAAFVADLPMEEEASSARCWFTYQLEDREGRVFACNSEYQWLIQTQPQTQPLPQPTAGVEAQAKQQQQQTGWHKQQQQQQRFPLTHSAADAVAEEYSESTEEEVTSCQAIDYSHSTKLLCPHLLRVSFVGLSDVSYPLVLIAFGAPESQQLSHIPMTRTSGDVFEATLSLPDTTSADEIVMKYSFKYTAIVDDQRVIQCDSPPFVVTLRTNSCWRKPRHTSTSDSPLIEREVQ